MHVREILRRSDTLVGLARDARKLSGLPRRLAQLRHRRELVDAYLRAHEIRKLQLGAGPTSLPGWLNTDLAPSAPGIVLLDATKPFPIADGMFDYVFSEHMIEHVPWKDGIFMLRECRRVLRPGGTVRIATPDLEVFLRLRGHEGDGREGRYVHWVTDRYMADRPVYKATFVINNLFREFGHEFLYDGELLALALAEAGFPGARRAEPGQSGDPNLRGIESHGKVVRDEEMGDFETMVFEADRPA
jgi:predicted SAM-dependent methyltransferase